MNSSPQSRCVAIVGRGRLGTTLAGRFERAGRPVIGPLGRRYGTPDLDGAEMVLLCVPDHEIAGAAALVSERRASGRALMVGHCSGATDLEVLGAPEAFSLHPLMTVAAADPDLRWDGAVAAVAGSTVGALEAARGLALDLGLRPVTIADEDRPAYHAAASIASNFLVTLEAAAARLAATAGAERNLLVPLVRQTVENWAAHGGHALTGPIARGDRETVARQRAAVSERAPDLLDLFDALAEATAALAAAPSEDSRETVGEVPPHAAAAPGLATVRTVAELRAALAPARRAGRVIGLVPTMGALHEGHLSLIRRARAECGEVVVSLFVNPTQFDEPADLERYPRDEARDLALAQQAGADLVFAPGPEEVYPAGFATTVTVSGVTEPLEGAGRGSGHFAGVSTVVTKLLIAAMPDIAYFGQKDAQQTVVIRRLARDLDLPVRIELCPTVREPDGLALSSRNALLDLDQRRRAVALSRALAAAEHAIKAGERSAAALLGAARQAMKPFAVDPEYLALVDPATLEPVDSLEGPALLAVAARVGPARLIDNAMLEPPAVPRAPRAQAPLLSLTQSRTEQRCSV